MSLLAHIGRTSAKRLVRWPMYTPHPALGSGSSSVSTSPPLCAVPAGSRQCPGPVPGGAD